MRLKILFSILIFSAISCDKCGGDLASYNKLNKEHTSLTSQEKELMTAIIEITDDDEKQMQLMDELFMIEVEIIDNENQTQSLKEKSECI